MQRYTLEVWSTRVSKRTILRTPETPSSPVFHLRLSSTRNRTTFLPSLCLCRRSRQYTTLTLPPPESPRVTQTTPVHGNPLIHYPVLVTRDTSFNPQVPKKILFHDSYPHNSTEVHKDMVSTHLVGTPCTDRSDG